MVDTDGVVVPDVVDDEDIVVDETSEDGATVLVIAVDTIADVVVDIGFVDVVVEVDCDGAIDVRTDAVGTMVVVFITAVSLQRTGAVCGHEGSFG